jgi:hypothetical protein
LYSAIDILAAYVPPSLNNIGVAECESNVLSALADGIEKWQAEICKRTFWMLGGGMKGSKLGYHV